MEAYWAIDQGGQSWVSDLNVYARPVVEMRLKLKDPKEGGLQGQWGWRFNEHTGDNRVDLLVFDPYRVAQLKQTREELKQAYNDQIERSTIIL